MVMRRVLRFLSVFLLFQLSLCGGAIGHAARSGGHSCTSCELKPFYLPFTPLQQSFARRSTPPHPPHHLPPEQSVPIGDFPGSNGSLAMPALLRLPSWRLPFTDFLRRSFSLLPFLSGKSPDSPHFLPCFFPNSSPAAISFIFTPVSLTHSIVSSAPFLHHLNQLVSLISLAWLHLIAYPVGY